MTDVRKNIDLERFIRKYRPIINEAGGRGFDIGVRMFDCPLCGDSKGRGWVNVHYFTAGCFNAGCVAEPRLEGHAADWVRRVAGLRDRAEVWKLLLTEYHVDRPIEHKQAPAFAGDDWCRFPKEARHFEASGSAMQRMFTDFMAAQWGLTVDVARDWHMRYALEGKHAWRIIIPIVMNQTVVGFQARHIRGGEPKYLTSSNGPQHDSRSECARPAAAMLFNVDAVMEGQDVLLVEGAADAIAWMGRGTDLPACALLGVALTPQKIAMLARRKVARVIVALDAEPQAQQRARSHIEDLGSWGLTTALGAWVNGKDAGSGADLQIIEPDASLAALVRSRLGYTRQ